MIDWSEILKRYGNRSLFLTENGEVSYSEFVDLIREKAIAGSDDAAISLSLEWTAESFAKFFGVLDSGRSVVLDESISEPDLSHFPDGRPFLILRSGCF